MVSPSESSSHTSPLRTRGGVLAEISENAGVHGGAHEQMSSWSGDRKKGVGGDEYVVTNSSPTRNAAA